MTKRYGTFLHWKWYEIKEEMEGENLEMLNNNGKMVDMNEMDVQSYVGRDNLADTVISLCNAQILFNFGWLVRTFIRCF